MNKKREEKGREGKNVRSTNVAEPRMPSANVFDDCLFKGEEKLRKGKKGEECASTNVADPRMPSANGKRKSPRPLSRTFP